MKIPVGVPKMWQSLDIVAPFLHARNGESWAWSTAILSAYGMTRFLFLLGLWAIQLKGSVLCKCINIFFEQDSEKTPKIQVTLTRSGGNHATTTTDSQRKDEMQIPQPDLRIVPMHTNKNSTNGAGSQRKPTSPMPFQPWLFQKPKLFSTTSSLLLDIQWRPQVWLCAWWMHKPLNWFFSNLAAVNAKHVQDEWHALPA